MGHCALHKCSWSLCKNWQNPACTSLYADDNLTEWMGNAKHVCTLLLHCINTFQFVTSLFPKHLAGWPVLFPWGRYWDLENLHVLNSTWSSRAQCCVWAQRGNTEFGGNLSHLSPAHSAKPVSALKPLPGWFKQRPRHIHQPLSW